MARETVSPSRASLMVMRLLTYASCVSQVIVCTAQVRNEGPTLRIPQVHATFDLDGQPVPISAWGTLSIVPAGTYRLALTMDLGGLQEFLTPLLRAQLNRSDRCGERLSVERATIAPAAPAAQLAADVHYERFACVKAFGKEMVKRLVAGNGVLDVNLIPSAQDKRVELAALIRRVEADGSLGELLRSGSLGDTIREKIAAGIQRALEKAVNLHATLPMAIEEAATLESAEFADGGSGRLWIALAGTVHLSPAQFQAAAKTLTR